MKRTWSLFTILFLLVFGIYVTFPYKTIKSYYHLPTYPPYLDSIYVYGTYSICTVGQHFTTTSIIANSTTFDFKNSATSPITYACVSSVGVKVN